MEWQVLGKAHFGTVGGGWLARRNYQDRDGDQCRDEFSYLLTHLLFHQNHLPGNKIPLFA